MKHSILIVCVAAGAFAAYLAAAPDAPTEAAPSSAPSVWATQPVGTEKAITLVVGSESAQGVEVNWFQSYMNQGSLFTARQRRFVPADSSEALNYGPLTATPTLPWGQIGAEEEIQFVLTEGN